MGWMNRKSTSSLHRRTAFVLVRGFYLSIYGGTGQGRTGQVLYWEGGSDLVDLLVDGYDDG
jgi:hypothetical protein